MRVRLAHELRMPSEVARQASELFTRYSEGEGPDLFQRRLRMSNFTSLLQDAAPKGYNIKMNIIIIIYYIILYCIVFYSILFYSMI